ncbi:hypothetical protein BFJ67_g18126 [Fusarium oxysporum f. sp. cepae]|nr:hypothetical protein BFJ67_g18126 [Fusarium oxysporum f. sp. cepae]
MSTFASVLSSDRLKLVAVSGSLLAVELVENSAAEMSGFVDGAIGSEGVGAGDFVRQLETRRTQ